MTQISPTTAARLEKAALDNGFDRLLPREGDWLPVASTRAPLRVWLTARNELFLAALSMPNVARELSDHGTAFASPLPPGACAARGVVGIPALHALLRRAFQLSRTLPDALLREFEDRTAALPRATEAERLVVERVGQDVFRDGLLDYWQGRCAITGLAVPPLLRASHIKPWAACATDAERLDPYNGLLLAPHLDAAFDRGYITLAPDGTVVVSRDVDAPARRLLGLDPPRQARTLTDAHRHYLEHHHAHVFRTGEGVVADAPSKRLREALDAAVLAGVFDPMTQAQVVAGERFSNHPPYVRAEDGRDYDEACARLWRALGGARRPGEPTLAEAHAWLAARVAEARAGHLDACRYPDWAEELERVWPAIVGFEEDDGVKDLLRQLHGAIRALCPALFTGEEPAADSPLAARRSALRPPLDHLWFWPELIDDDDCR